MADGSWAEKVAARVRSGGEKQHEAGRPVPAWSRVVADRAMGRPVDPETLAAAKRWAQRPRTETDRRILERLGFTQDQDDDGPPPAA